MPDLRLVGLVLVLLARIAQAGTPRFEPPSPIANAQEKYLRGKKLYAEKNFAAAGDEFAAAYAIDPDSKFLLFNVALAWRMAGACIEALAAYRAFIAAEPPAEQANNARIGIDRCEQSLKQPSITIDKPGTDDKPPAPDSMPNKQPPVADRPREAQRPAIEPPPRHVPWYSDGVGNVLVGTGAAALLASAGFQLLARSAARTTYHPASLADYETNRDSAASFELLSWISAGAGVALVVGGVIHIKHHQRAASVAVVPAGDGVAVTLGGQF